MDDLPEYFDAIVVGTGMIESVIAAALSRIGKSVLHLDPNEYYGENWASFNLEAFENWATTCTKNDSVSETCHDQMITETEKVINVNPHSNVWNIELKQFSVKAKKTCDENNEISTEIKDGDSPESEPQDEFQKLSRRFNLDLCPKLLFSKGMLVQLLISSNIARYAEFKSVSRVLTWRDDQLEPVPCSRADVFTTKNVSVVQKRILVTILTLFANYTKNLDEFKGFENKTFLDYLKYKKLPDNLIHYILYAIAMGDNSTSCLDGVKNCKAFLESLGCYGNTPFIFPMYGSGELPQCFCRLCAVFGGTYCLQRGIECLITSDNKCVGVVSNKKRINAKTVVLSARFAPKNFLLADNSENISRGIFITDRSILKNDKDSLTLLQFPPIPNISSNTVTVLELGSGTCTAPDNYFVVHMTTKMIANASSDLKHVINSLFETEESGTDKKDNKPKILWSATWNVAKGSSQISGEAVENVKICSSVDSELDYDCSISEARRIFKELYPEEEFLPRAPDPDEIVLENEEKSEEGVDTQEEKSNQGVDTQEEKSNQGVDTQEEKSNQGVDIQEKSVESVDTQEGKSTDGVHTQKEKLDEGVDTTQHNLNEETCTSNNINKENNSPDS